MKDEIIDGVVGITKFAVSVVLWNLVLFNLGRFVLLLATFGRYPRGTALTRHANRIALTGLMVIAMVWCGIALYNNFATDHAAYLNHVAR